MGMFRKNCCLYSTNTTIEATAPNPREFSILESFQVGTTVVTWIKYPNCTNYEGNKVVVFKNTTIKNLERRKEIDPHFSSEVNSPFARFEPTLNGLKAAITLAELL